MYEWLKAFHVIAVIAWMAGMLYLPRLFVYHCEAEPGSKQSETFKVMERRLLTRDHHSGHGGELGARPMARLGRGLVYASGWLHAKVVLVLVLSALHGFFLRAACAISPLTAIAIRRNSIELSMRCRPFS